MLLMLLLLLLGFCDQLLEPFVALISEATASSQQRAVSNRSAHAVGRSAIRP